MENDAAKAQSHVHGQQTEVYERTGEGVQRQSAVDHRQDPGRRRRPDRNPRDDGQVLDRRDRQLRVRLEAGRYQRPELGVPEARKKRFPAIAQVQDPSGGHIHAAVPAEHIPSASLLAPHHPILPRRIQADNRVPGEAQRRPQRLCTASDEGQRRSGVESEPKTRRKIH